MAALADEAGIPLNWLNRQYADLRDDFVERKEAFEADPPPATPREEELIDKIEKQESQIAELKKALANAKHARDQWKVAAQQFVRIIALKERELLNENTIAKTHQKAKIRLQAAVNDLKQERDGLADELALTTSREPSPVRLRSVPEDQVDVRREPVTATGEDQEPGSD